MGLVGGIGAGKSRVAALLAEKGAQILDADAIGHVLLNQPPARDQVIAHFGSGVVDREGEPDSQPSIDRKVLGAIVFGDESGRKALEAILHPRMRQTFEKAIARAARRRTNAAVVLDAAVLFEAKWHDLCDVVVFVDAPAETRLERVAHSRGWSAETLAARESAQLPLDVKRSRSDFVLENISEHEGLAAGVDAIWDKLIWRPRPDSHRGLRKSPDPS